MFSWTRTGLPALMLLAAALFIAVPAWNLLMAGPFRWHVAQPAYWQGGLEALALVALVGGGCAMNTRWGLLLALLPAAFYLRRHAIDVPVAIDIAYLEIVIGLGMLLRGVMGAKPPQASFGYVKTFVAGFVVWSTVAWTLSAFNHGSIGALRSMTLCLAIAAALGRPTPFMLHLWRRMRAATAFDRFWGGALAAWMLVLYARTNTAFGYDPLWYGLRPEYVLDPGASVYEPLGLVSPVYYFPKLYEVFLLPVSRLGDTSVIAGMTICLLMLLLVTCHALGERLRLPNAARMPVLALVATLPALANTAIEPKPDTLALLFLLLGCIAAFEVVQSRRRSAVAWFLTCSMLACLAKLTAIPYVGVLGIATLIAALLLRRTANEADHGDHKPRLEIVVCALAALLAVFVTSRTLLLAGMPTVGPDPLVRLWHALGMNFRAPVGTLTWTSPQDWSDVPMLFVDWLFRPQLLEHIIISWVGNVWLWLTLVALLARSARHNAAAPPRWPLVVMMATALLLATGIRYGVRGSDGNYFLAGLVPAILVGASAALGRLASSQRHFACALACISAFVLFQGAYAFVSAAWTPGTSAFDANLRRPWRDTAPTRWKILENAGIADIGRHLKETTGAARVVGYVEDAAGLWLPARYEHLVTIGFSRPEYLADGQQFQKFLQDQHIRYLILPKPAVQEQHKWIAQGVKEFAVAVVASPNVRILNDRDYVLLDLLPQESTAGTY